MSTTAEVYMLDQEFISVKEARKWDKRDFDIDEIGIYEPIEAPGLSHSILSLIDRVNRIDKDSVRLDFQPDHRMISNNNGRNNFKVGQRALFLLKQVTGVTLYKSRKNFNNNWESFRKDQLKKNNQCKNEK
ncbi:MAG: hypothetical protein K2F94_08025 [Muribaculaceae bacterium]|nr:hypothetical protein [Muribaculaceae bacterium]